MGKKSVQKNGLVKGAKKKAKLLYLYDIVALVEEHDVPPGLVLNLDQAPLKYIPAARQSLVKVQNQCRSPHYPIKKYYIDFSITVSSSFFQCSLLMVVKPSKLSQDLNSLNHFP